MYYRQPAFQILRMDSWLSGVSRVSFSSATTTRLRLLSPAWRHYLTKLRTTGEFRKSSCKINRNRYRNTAVGKAADLVSPTICPSIQTEESALLVRRTSRLSRLLAGNTRMQPIGRRPKKKGDALKAKIGQHFHGGDCRATQTPVSSDAAGAERGLIMPGKKCEDELIRLQSACAEIRGCRDTRYEDIRGHG